MAKAIKTHAGVGVFLNGHLLTPHVGPIKESDHKEPQIYMLLTSKCLGPADQVWFSYTNRYVLKFGDGEISGLSFTEPTSEGDIISVVDSGMWGLNVVHYLIGEEEDYREISLNG